MEYKDFRFVWDMSLDDSMLIQVLKKKPLWLFKLEAKVDGLQQQIVELRDQLEESNIENNKLKELSESIPIVQYTCSHCQSPQFKLSL